MNRTTLSALALAAATLLSANVMAADGNTAKTRQQVKAELTEAIRTGDIIANSETGQTLTDLYPGLYPAKAPVVGKTRAQVRTELSDAIRSGDIVLNVETGQSLNQMEPGRYPAKEAEAGKTREQVKAELAVAIRTGNLIVNV